MTETSSEQASVVFMGRGSFRMEAVGAPGLHELAIPSRASDIPTERIFRVKGDSAFLPVALPAPVAVHPWRSASKGALIGLGGVMFALGMLVMSPAAHSWLRLGPRSVPIAPATVLPTPVVAAPVIVPAAPAPIEPVEPIVVAAAPAPVAAPARRVVVPKSSQTKRARAVRPLRAKRPAEAATGGPLPEPESSAVSPTPAKKWVDPFAE